MDGEFYRKTGDYVSGDGALVHVQVRVNPCSACGGADRSHTAFWNSIERLLVFCLMERLLTLHQ